MSIKSVHMLRDLQFVPRKVMKKCLPEAAAAMSRLLYLINLNPESPDACASRDTSKDSYPSYVEGAEDDNARGMPASLEHVPMLLYNLSRLAAVHTGIKTHLQKQDKPRLKAMFEVRYFRALYEFVCMKG